MRIRVGVILAMAAWLMQLSVFLTPILSSQIGVGYGVCEELAAFTRSPEAVTAADPSGMADMADMARMPGMTMAHADPVSHTSDPTVPQHHPSHHPSHALCGFCLLLGHSVLPVSITIEPVSLRAVHLAIRTTIGRYRASAIPLNKSLRPQGRAPPLFFI